MYIYQQHCFLAGPALVAAADFNWNYFFFFIMLLTTALLVSSFFYIFGWRVVSF